MNSLIGAMKGSVQSFISNLASPHFSIFVNDTFSLFHNLLPLFQFFFKCFFLPEILKLHWHHKLNGLHSLGLRWFKARWEICHFQSYFNFGVIIDIFLLIFSIQIFKIFQVNATLWKLLFFPCYLRKIRICGYISSQCHYTPRKLEKFTILNMISWNLIATVAKLFWIRLKLGELVKKVFKHTSGSRQVFPGAKMRGMIGRGNLIRDWEEEAEPPRSQRKCRKLFLEILWKITNFNQCL